MLSVRIQIGIQYGEADFKAGNLLVKLDQLTTHEIENRGWKQEITHPVAKFVMQDFHDSGHIHEVLLQFMGNQSLLEISKFQR
jgi:hypothetical protein